LCVIIESSVEGFETGSEFGKPVIPVVVFVLLRLLGGLASFFGCLGVSSVFGETEFGLHDEPEDREHDG
jgi:hypothetical protein